MNESATQTGSAEGCFEHGFAMDAAGSVRGHWNGDTGGGAQTVACAARGAE